MLFEKVHYKVAEVKAQGKSAPRWYKGIWAGVTTTDNTAGHVILTPNGAETVRVVSRLMPSEQWDAAAILACCGFCCKVLDFYVPPVPLGTEEEEEAEDAAKLEQQRREREREHAPRQAAADCTSNDRPIFLAKASTETDSLPK